MSLNNNSELAASVTQIVNHLIEAGEVHMANGLNEALHISMLPGEIYGATRLQLTQLKSKPMISDLGLDQQVEEAINYLTLMLHKMSNRTG